MPRFLPKLLTEFLNEWLLKLWRIVITGDLWWWFKSYLSYRQQCVCFNGSYSIFLPVLSGVSQGSILGPLMFLIYINNLFSTVHTSNALSFADNTKCYKLILELRDSAKLQHDLNSMAIWSRDWNLFFKTNKFIHLSFNSKFLTSYFVGNSTIQTSNSHRDLCIIIILSTNSWKDHYNHIIAKAYRAQMDLQSFNWHLNKESFVLALVRSQLLYCSPIWHPYLLCDITALKRIYQIHS